MTCLRWQIQHGLPLDLPQFSTTVTVPATSTAESCNSLPQSRRSADVNVGCSLQLWKAGLQLVALMRALILRRESHLVIPRSETLIAPT
jgi:hypothetical protein